MNRLRGSLLTVLAASAEAQFSSLISRCQRLQPDQRELLRCGLSPVFGEKFLPGRSDRQEKSIRKASEKLGTMKGFFGAGCSCAAPNLALRLSTLPGFVRSNWFTGRRQTAGQSISCQRLRAEVRKRLIYKYHQISTICCNTLVKHDRFSPVFACLCEAVQVCKLPIFLAESWSDGSNLQALWVLCSRNQ